MGRKIMGEEKDIGIEYREKVILGEGIGMERELLDMEGKYGGG